MTEAAHLAGRPAIAKYELLEEIGHGGMATVYRAKDPRLNREVAVKVIHKHLRDNPEVSTRFIAEARAAAKLRHPAIVEVFDVSAETDREKFLVVELVRGTTLRKLLQDDREMPAEIGACIGLLLAEAIHHAHLAGIVHRDIKPENVLVELPRDRGAADAPVRYQAPHEAQRDDARMPALGHDKLTAAIKITDFGIAKILDAQGVTSTGQVLGSPAHMAPEQIEGGEVSARTDVFALGVLIYECMVGHLPFEGKNPAQVLRRVLEGEYTLAAVGRPSVGGRWSRIIDQSLAKETEARTKSAALLAEQIRSELIALEVRDPLEEVTRYFEDPVAYRKGYAARIVPLLLGRGDAARRTRDISGAADDFNRALALSPNDASVLKRIARLRSSARRQRVFVRLAKLSLASVVLGGVAFVGARSLRNGQQLPVPKVDPAPSADATRSLPLALPSVSSGGQPAEVKTALPLATLAVSAPPVGSTLPRPVAEVPRRLVSFALIPKSARLLLDGQEVSWFGRTLPVSVGPHNVDVSVKDSPCCKERRETLHIDAAPEGSPDEVKSVVIKLEIRPSTVTLVDAPPNAQYSCPSINLSGFVGVSQTVVLPEPKWSVPCEFMLSTPNGTTRKRRVSLSAGEANSIPWPSD